MSIEFEFEADRLTIKTRGRFSDDEMIEAMTKITADSRFEPGLNILLDHLDSTAHMTPGQFVKFVDFMSRRRELFSGVRFAVVTRRSMSVVMVRMISTVAKGFAFDVRAFSSFRAADEWLSSPNPWLKAS